jgi:hypothetical protein
MSQGFVKTEGFCDLLGDLRLHELPEVKGLVGLLGDHFKLLLLVWQLERLAEDSNILGRESLPIPIRIQHQKRNEEPTECPCTSR